MRALFFGFFFYFIKSCEVIKFFLLQCFCFFFFQHTRLLNLKLTFEVVYFLFFGFSRWEMASGGILRNLLLAVGVLVSHNVLIMIFFLPVFLWIWYSKGSSFFSKTELLLVWLFFISTLNLIFGYFFVLFSCALFHLLICWGFGPN